MKRLRGFSLMEMMIVLLIVSIVAAASAPMINKKLVRAASEKSPWVWVGTSQSIAYNLNGSDARTATIGAEEYSSNDNKPRLFIQSPSANNPHIALRSSIEAPLRISWQDNTISMSTINKGKNNSNSVIIGKGISTGIYQSSGIVAVGAGITNPGAGATVLGYKAKAANSGTAVGDGAHSKEGGVAVGFGSNAQTVSSIAIGSATVSNESGGSSSTAIGAGSFAKGSSSIALGSTANASNHYSIAIGSDNTTAYGKHSIAIGSNNTAAHGNYSIAIGSNETGAAGMNSIAIGYNTTSGLSHMYTEGNSVAIGYNAHISGLHSNTSIVLGPNAHVVGNYSWRALAIGNNARAGESDSIAIGHNANVTQSNAIAIGRDANCRFGDSTAIGYNARVTSHNQIMLGTSNTTVVIPGNLVVAGDVLLNAIKGDTALRPGNKPNNIGVLRTDDWEGSDQDFRKYPTDINNKTWFDTYIDDKSMFNISTSDKRLKNIGKAFVVGLEEVKKLEVFNYTFKKDPNKTPRVGVMAQDLQKIFPNAVIKGEDGFLRIRMEDMFYALVNAVRELDAKIEALKNNEIKELKDRVTALEKKNKMLKKRAEVLEKKLK